MALQPGVEPDDDWVDTASMRIAHRGPDAAGRYSDCHVAMGFRRLAIIDRTPSGHQPMASRDGRYWIVFNGEIYNYLELGEELRCRGVELRTRSDTEVLLELYALMGHETVHRLRGMFAFAIWDTCRHELFAARDPFGIKPFFYAETDGALRFASEKKALVQPASAAGPVDPVALRRYLAFQHVPAPDTLTPGVRALPPGHALTVRPAARPPAHSHPGPVVQPYWRPTLRPTTKPRPTTPDRILAAVRDSVRVHLRSEAPLGAFLSGGIDSAAICRLASEHRPDLHAFTVGFDFAGFNEIDHAQQTAEAIGISTTSCLISTADVVRHLPQIVWHLDDPLADPSAVPLWFLAREASKEVRVVLSGEGADELFGGYGVYRQPGVVRAGQHLPEWSRQCLRGIARLLPDGMRGRGLLHRTATPLVRRYIGNAHVFVDSQLDWVARTPDGSPYDVTDPVYAQSAQDGLDDVSSMQLVDITTWLPGDILAKADRMTMAHGLELRVPFLDREVFAVAAGLARGEKLNGRATKHALRQAVRRLLPEEVIERAKLGFPVPIRHWLAGELSGWAEEILRLAATDEYINRSNALGLLRQHRAGLADHGRRLWALLVFSLWHQVFVERLYDPVALGWQAPPTPRLSPCWPHTGQNGLNCARVTA